MTSAPTLLLALAFALFASTGAAACYADYRASRDGPLQLQYGVAQVSEPCDRGSAADELEPRLAADGWQLLEVIATFGEDGLEERRESAGEFFLRY